MDIITLALAKKYSQMIGMGISNISIEGTTMTFTLNDGTTSTMTFPQPADGVSIVDTDIDVNNHLVCTLSNGETIDAGEVKTLKGDTGRGIRDITKISTSGLIDTYSINYTDNTSSTYNVKNGADAKINGLNELYLVAGDGIKLTQEGNRITISVDGTPPSPSEGEQLVTSENEIFITSDNYNFIVEEGE